MTDRRFAQANGLRQGYLDEGDEGAAAEDVAALIDGLAGGRAHVVGHDWGGVVGYRMAARFPEKVASLVTIAIPATGAQPRRRQLSTPCCPNREWWKPPWVGTGPRGPAPPGPRPAPPLKPPWPGSSPSTRCASSGRRTAASPPSWPRGWRAWFPAGLRVEVLPEAGHFVHLERPAEVNELILVHLERGH